MVYDKKFKLITRINRADISPIIDWIVDFKAEFTEDLSTNGFILAGECTIKSENEEETKPGPQVEINEMDEEVVEIEAISLEKKSEGIRKRPSG